MFRGSYQRKLLTVLYSGGSNPLEIWSIQVKNGWTRRLKDDEIGSIVFEIAGTNVATAYIVSPPEPKAVLGISLPFITMVVKNLKRYFTFEIQIIDDKQMRRRFRFSNYQSSTKVRPFACSMPLSLQPGWNQMQLNLANFTMRAYGTNYIETQRVQIHANCRIRRVYFSDRIYSEQELPKDYRTCMKLRPTPAPTKSAPLEVPVNKIQTTKSGEEPLSPILKQPPPSGAGEMVVSETTFSGTDSHSRSTGFAKDSKTSTALGSESGKASSKGEDGGKAVTFDISPTTSKGSIKHKTESDRGDEARTEQPDETESVPEKSEAETPRTDVPEEPVEAESPRTEATESEFAESEQIPESDAEEILEEAGTERAEDPPGEATVVESEITNSPEE